MQPNDRFLLETIKGYCDDIDWAVKSFSLTEKEITENPGFRAMLAFFVQQIGETSGKLSEEFKNSHPEVEWKAIIGFRNHIVHAYGKVIPEILWDTVKNDIPELRDFCTAILATIN